MRWFKRIVIQFRLWQARTNEKRAEQSRSDLTRLMLVLAQRKLKLVSFQERLERQHMEMAAFAVDLEAKFAEAELDRARCEETIEHLRQEVKVYAETTIPGLVTANKLLIERWNAQTAVEIRKQVVVNPSDMREM